MPLVSPVSRFIILLLSGYLARLDRWVASCRFVSSLDCSSLLATAILVRFLVRPVAAFLVRPVVIYCFRIATTCSADWETE